MGPSPPPQSPSSTGLLLVGHGTRNVRGQAELLETARQVAACLTEVYVEPAFLELSEPTIAQGIERLAAHGIDSVTVAPLLLFSAGHAKADIPQAVSRALESFPQLSLNWTSPFACHAKILELSSLRYHEAISAVDQVAGDNTLLVMVGRGSSDNEAVAQMREFSRLRAANDQQVHIETCFFAKSEPSLAEMLEKASRHPARRVVVQPHLLFEGQLTESLARQVKAAAEAHPRQRWIVARHLAPHELLVRATVEIVETTVYQRR